MRPYLTPVLNSFISHRPEFGPQSCLLVAGDRLEHYRRNARRSCLARLYIHSRIDLSDGAFGASQARQHNTMLAAHLRQYLLEALRETEAVNALREPVRDPKYSELDWSRPSLEEFASALSDIMTVDLRNEAFKAGDGQPILERAPPDDWECIAEYIRFEADMDALPRRPIEPVVRFVRVVDDVVWRYCEPAAPVRVEDVKRKYRTEIDVQTSVATGAIDQDYRNTYREKISRAFQRTPFASIGSEIADEFFVFVEQSPSVQQQTWFKNWIPEHVDDWAKDRQAPYTRRHLGGRR